MTKTALPAAKQLFRNQNIQVFSLLWALTFIIYLPAAKAGWVIDVAGWLYNIRNLSFWNYINNTQSELPSLYQFTQFVTYLFYKLFNANPYAWHTLMVTLHAINAYLVYRLCNDLFSDSGIKNARNIALLGVGLYTICPHISEVIVWEASFHYLQGFLFILLIMRWVQLFMHLPRTKLAWWAGIAFFCSSYALEIFYLTPWFVLTLALYYRYVLNYSQAVFKRTLLLFFLPMLLLFGAQLLVLQLVYGGHFAHIDANVMQPFSSYICKPPRYLFHVLLLGRYFPQPVRKAVYDSVGSNAGLIIFYNIFVLIWCAIISRFPRMSATGKASVLMLVWIMICLVILMPLAFPTLLLMFYDRYTYFLDAFTYMLIALLISYISRKWLRAALLGAYAAINLYFTITVNIYWKQSAYINNRLMKDLPNPGDKIMILLNFPENLNGVPMIGAQSDHKFKVMRELFVDKSYKGKIYDGASFNMLTKNDGAHVFLVNDSLMRVTLNQWGTWWWYAGHGAASYENEDYKLEMKDIGHWFEVKLKHPIGDYMLLYQAGDQWKIVDTSKKMEEQY